MEEQQPRVSTWRGRLCQNGAEHMCVPARLEHDGAANVIYTATGPFEFFDHRFPAGSRKAADDQPQRPAAGVSVDGPDDHGRERLESLSSLVIGPVS